MNVRQVILFVPLSLFLFQLLQKNFKESIYGLVWFICFYLYFVLIFPQTPRMVEVPLQFHHIVKPHYLYAIVYGILIYLAVFLAPFFIGFTSQLYIKNRRSTLLVFFAFFLSLVLYFVLPANYKPDAVSWGEFPYFENTFERTGFYPRGIHGTKYQFKGIYDLYYYLDILAKILVSVGIGALLFLKKRLNNFYTFLIATYFAIMVVVETFYDRYILILIPLVIIWFFEMKYKLTNINKLLVSGFLLAFMFLSYQFAMDFILVNRYVWNRAEQLAHEQAIDKNLIQATNPWKLQYRNLKKDYIYNFSYDSQSVNPDYANLYELVEEKEVNFKYSIFIEPKIYLYKLK